MSENAQLGYDASESEAWQKLAREAATPAAEEHEVLREVLVCELGPAAYGIPVDRVREIVRLKTITPVPRVPAWVRGVIVLRGEVVQVVDMQMRLGVEPRPFDRRTRIVVLHADRERVTGVLVDAVRKVLRLPETDFRPASGDNNFVTELCEHEGEFISIVELEDGIEVEDDDV